MERIDPELKEFQLNNTFALLAPIVNCFSNELKNSVYGMSALCWGVGDCHYSTIHKKEKLDAFLFLLVDRCGKWLNDKKRYENLKLSKKEFSKNMKLIRNDPHYVTDYSWNYLDNRHMIVFKIPKKYLKAFDKFLLGEYSKMYSDHDIEVLKIANTKMRISIVKKDKEFIPFFEKGLNNYYGTNVELDEDFDGELALPFIPKREVFNWEDEFKFLINSYKKELINET